MQLKSAGMIPLGILGLAISALIPAIQSYVLFVMALAPFALLVIGQLILPRAKRSITVWFNPIVLEIDGETFSIGVPGTSMARLSGRELFYSYFRQWHDFEIEPQRFLLLGAIGLVSLGAMWFSWRVQLNFFSGAGFYYLMLFVWMVLLGFARRWFWERRMLRLEGVSIATFLLHGRQMKYHFVDPEGHYRGGCVDALITNRRDDMTVVFYDEMNPDRNIPASALIFHKLRWKEQTPSAEEPVAPEQA
jgi:hypothetical protein